MPSTCGWEKFRHLVDMERGQNIMWEDAFILKITYQTRRISVTVMFLLENKELGRSNVHLSLVGNKDLIYLRVWKRDHAWTWKSGWWFTVEPAVPWPIWTLPFLFDSCGDWSWHILKDTRFWLVEEIFILVVCEKQYNL